MVRPLRRYTSSARWMRWASVAWMRAPASGSMPASSACSAAHPCACASAEIPARVASSACGIPDRPSSNARKYKPVPPARIGSLPRATMAAIAARASCANSAAEYGCQGERISIRWCGTCASSACVGLAAPISSPRYTSAESTLMISPPRRCAKSSAYAVLPDAVGPINAIARGRGSAPIYRSTQALTPLANTLLRRA